MNSHSHSHSCDHGLYQISIGNDSQCMVCWRWCTVGTAAYHAQPNLFKKSVIWKNSREKMNKRSTL